MAATKTSPRKTRKTAKTAPVTDLQSWIDPSDENAVLAAAKRIKEKRKEIDNTPGFHPIPVGAEERKRNVVARCRHVSVVSIDQPGVDENGKKCVKKVPVTFRINGAIVVCEGDKPRMSLELGGCFGVQGDTFKADTCDVMAKKAILGQAAKAKAAPQIAKYLVAEWEKADPVHTPKPRKS